jgi:NAD-dependent dihydropyrimidine dehydrogenase PreA subunit
MGAHVARAGWGLAGGVGFALLPLLLLLRRRWVPLAVRWLLVAGAAEWVHTAWAFARVREQMGQPSLRLWLVLGGVAAFSLLAAALVSGPRVAAWFDRRPEAARASAGAFLVTFALLAFLQGRLELRVLLLDRFLPGAGWAEALALSAYAALVAEWLLEAPRIATWRLRIWLLFSVAFFAQLGLGLLGFDRFLMTGALHVPVPAVIAGGPVFRGGGLFMPVLFLATIAFVGPAWCSHLCYLGAWDNAAAVALPRARKTPRWLPHLRWAFLALVVGGALALRLAGVPGVVAAGFGVGFGLVGVAWMVLWSRRRGVMTHCVGYCPIGALATALGKLSPFRLEIGEGCTECRLCSLVCRYRALEIEHLQRRRPGISCTLCGDCLPSCEDGFIRYRFLRLSPAASRRLFVAMAAALHAVFLGVARI